MVKQQRDIKKRQQQREINIFVSIGKIAVRNEHIETVLRSHVATVIREAPCKRSNVTSCEIELKPENSINVVSWQPLIYNNYVFHFLQLLQ